MPKKPKFLGAQIDESKAHQSEYKIYYIFLNLIEQKNNKNQMASLMSRKSSKLKLDDLLIWPKCQLPLEDKIIGNSKLNVARAAVARKPLILS
jgi:hypothetical protein